MGDNLDTLLFPHKLDIAYLEVQLRYVKMRLAQIASGDYKICGYTAEQVAADALAFLEDKNG